MTASSSGACEMEMQQLDSVEPVEPGELVEPAAPGPVSSVELRRDLRPDQPSLQVARRAAIDRFEVEYVQNLLQKTGGNVTRAAALADVSRQVIHKLIARHRL